MFNLRRVTASGPLLVAVVLTVAACGGGAAATSPAGATTAPGETAAESTAPESAPASEGPTETETAEASIGAIPTFDLGALTAGLPGVDSYRTETSLGGEKQYESVVVTKPVLSKAVTVYDGGDVSMRMVIIGDEAWTADGPDGSFESVPTELAGTMLMAFDPALMLGGFAALDWAQTGSDQGTEEKNGVQARHVKVDSTTFVGAAAAMPPGAAIDVWIADAGYLVA